MTGQRRTRAAPRRLAGSWWLALLSGLAWLILSGIVLRLAGRTAAMVLPAAVVLLVASDQVLERARCSLPSRRKLDGHALAAALALLLHSFSPSCAVGSARPPTRSPSSWP